jgi:hypothetical protein
MGGAIVLAIATSVFNSYTRPLLAEYTSLSHPSASIYSAQSLARFDLNEQKDIKQILAHGYNLQMWVLCAFAAAQIPTAALLWREGQIMV